MHIRDVLSLLIACLHWPLFFVSRRLPKEEECRKVFGGGSFGSIRGKADILRLFRYQAVDGDREEQYCSPTRPSHRHARTLSPYQLQSTPRPNYFFLSA